MDQQAIPVNDSRGQIAPLIESLLTVLKTEIDLQRELQGSLDEEHRLLERPDADRLMQSTAQKETIILKVLMLEDVLSDIISKISCVALPGEEVTLAKISSLAPGPLQTELQVCREMLNSLVMTNRQLNEANRDLIDLSLTLVNNSLRVMTNLLAGGAGYAGTGESRAASLAGAVVCMEG